MGQRKMRRLVIRKAGRVGGEAERDEVPLEPVGEMTAALRKNKLGVADRTTIFLALSGEYRRNIRSYC